VRNRRKVGAIDLNRPGGIADRTEASDLLGSRGSETAKAALTSDLLLPLLPGFPYLNVGEAVSFPDLLLARLPAFPH
jgi:hypothetical protein